MTNISDELKQKLEDFRTLIAAEKKNENQIQAFLEANTTFMPTPDLLGHQLHLNSVIAKFRVGERSTDYAYLTKTSIEWQLVLVELEDSGKRIFKPSSNNLAFTSEFTDAVAQIDVWRDYAADSDEAAPRFRDDCAPSFRDDVAPRRQGRAGYVCCYFVRAGRQASEGDLTRRMLSPSRSRRWALWTSRSRMASA
ncbi:Shedu anti-phage system protein SduA domain-containing protein (plasmid) [Sphingomonas panni]